MPQRRFELVQLENNQFRPLRDNAPESKPPMTSKQAQKLHRETTRGPKRSKEEQRRFEKQEQERIKRELKAEEDARQKELEASRARAARERKKAKDKVKEDADRAARRQQGLAPVACRPSQDTISRFFLRPRSSASKQGALKTVVEDNKENEQPVITPVASLGDEDECNGTDARPRKQQKVDTSDGISIRTPELRQSRRPAQASQQSQSLRQSRRRFQSSQQSQPPRKSPRQSPRDSPQLSIMQSSQRREPSIQCDLSDDEVDADILATMQLISETQASELLQTMAEPTAPSPQEPPRVELEEPTEPIQSFEQLLPTSTQLFVFGHIDLFPSASQEMLELLGDAPARLGTEDKRQLDTITEDEEPEEAQPQVTQHDGAHKQQPCTSLENGEPPAQFILSSQDFVISTQDLEELETPPKIDRRRAPLSQSRFPAETVRPRCSPSEGKGARSSDYSQPTPRATCRPSPRRVCHQNSAASQRQITGTPASATDHQEETDGKGQTDSPPRQRFFTSSMSRAMNCMMEKRAMEESRRSFRLEEARRLEEERQRRAEQEREQRLDRERARRLEQEQAPHGERHRPRTTPPGPSPHDPRQQERGVGKAAPSNQNQLNTGAQQHVQLSQETDYGDLGLEELEELEATQILDGMDDYLDDDDDWTEVL